MKVDPKVAMTPTVQSIESNDKKPPRQSYTYCAEAGIYCEKRNIHRWYLLPISILQFMNKLKVGIAILTGLICPALLMNYTSLEQALEFTRYCYNIYIFTV